MSKKSKDICVVRTSLIAFLFTQTLRMCYLAHSLTPFYSSPEGEGEGRGGKEEGGGGGKREEGRRGREEALTVLYGSS